MEPVVSIRDLCYSYSGREPALERVGFDLQSGEFMALIGPNGGGKTTLLRIMLGLLKPLRGSVRILGGSPSSMSGRIGYVPQYSTLQPDFPASVLEMVLMGAARPSFWGAFWKTGLPAEKKALDYLDVLGLADCAKRPVRALSGGQRQRALIARALMGRPDKSGAGLPPSGGERPADGSFLLLLDEPTAGIDQDGKYCFYEFLGRLRGSISMIVVSHDLFMVSPFFSKVAFVNKNLTVLHGGDLSPENLTILFGRHLHECPVADLQHAHGAVHNAGCSHPACAGSEPERAGNNGGGPA